MSATWFLHPRYPPSSCTVYSPCRALITILRRSRETPLYTSACSLAAGTGATEADLCWRSELTFLSIAGEVNEIVLAVFSVTFAVAVLLAIIIAVLVE